MKLFMNPLIRPFVATAALMAIISQKGMAENEVDVIVYGSTPGGFCAAIGAAREGASVLLLEPTDHVGGLNTGGLSHCDSNQMVRSTTKSRATTAFASSQRIKAYYTRKRPLPCPFRT
jgi:ribulose 1,5-bisphosphate synthetase/thiazole synthase